MVFRTPAVCAHSQFPFAHREVSTGCACSERCAACLSLERDAAHASVFVRYVGGEHGQTAVCIMGYGCCSEPGYVVASANEELEGLVKAASAALQPGHAVPSSLLHASL